MLTNDASQRTTAAPYVLNKNTSEIVQTMKTLAVRETYFADLLA
jgi:hypothetical protein